jgi:hypothetical protein
MPKQNGKSGECREMLSQRKRFNLGNEIINTDLDFLPS